MTKNLMKTSYETPSVEIVAMQSESLICVSLNFDELPGAEDDPWGEF